MVDIDVSLPHAQRRFQRFDDAGAFGGRNPKAILHDLQPVFRLRMNTRVTLAFKQLQDFSFRKILRNLDREGHDQPRIAGVLRPRLQIGINGVGIVAAHGTRAAAAIELRCAGEQKLQVIGQFRHRSHGRTRGADRIGLVNGNGRRNAVDAIDLRLVHAVEKLAGVRRKCLHVTPLPLGIQRVEHQGRFAGTRYPGHHQQLVQREVDIEVLEVILARAMDMDGFGMLVGHGRQIGIDGLKTRGKILPARTGRLLFYRPEMRPRRSSAVTAARLGPVESGTSFPPSESET